MGITTSHPINTDIAITVGFNPKPERTEIHRAGCAHEAKLDYVHAFSADRIEADDYFDIAPCARAKKARA